MTAMLRQGARRNISLWIRNGWRAPCLCAGFALSIVSFLARSGGGDLSSIIVTFLAPGMLAYALQFASRRTISIVSTFLAFFFVANSMLGIFEFLSGLRLLPFYAADQLITFDNRPTALLGHPLINALLTCAVLLISLSKLVSLGLALRRLFCAGLHLCAAVVFGGRAALVLSGCLATFFLFRHFGVLSKVRVFFSRRAMTLALLGLICLAMLFMSGIADPLLERFVASAKSDHARIASAAVLTQLTPVEWLIGMEPDLRRAYQAMLETPFGFESAPIAMTTAYGLPLTLLLLLSTWSLLSRFARDAFAGSRAVIVYLMLASWTSLSIGSKSLLISQMLIILLCARIPADGTMPARAVAKDRRPSAFRRFAFSPKSRFILTDAPVPLVAREASVICSHHAVERPGHYSRRQTPWRDFGHRRGDDPLPWAPSGYGAFGTFADDAAGAPAGQ
ncbi:hypothetical protein QO002_001846 [Pararhizobium capsulatum DSM 1112]|uniref:O-antigen ligase like membrane protein n=2 Tax=Pararhizobium capsulatum TaxID=34014 RepID=A0ABU0BN76_9HYPH|nr:hypothetical protein [Pararhizobium capsulatum DSM 1112]